MKQEIPPAWGTTYDSFGDPSEAFTASRDGLVHLRNKIDEALEKGEAAVGSETAFDFQKIVVADIHPTQTLKPRPLLDKVMGCVGVTLVALFVFFGAYGCCRVFEDLKK
jgi:hypothetical protein